MGFADRSILELFHGPTLAFKDLALSLLPHLLVESRRALGITDKAVILTATSGDTGSAAIQGFSNVPGTEIIVFYPDGGVSPIQRKQMVSASGPNVRVCAVHGNFDDAQTAVKSIISDSETQAFLSARECAFSSANSINVGRLVPQMVYYLFAYAEMVRQGTVLPGDKINVVVPTGNFGNVLAAWYAKQMGLPVNKFLVASNTNRVLTDFFKTGVYDANREFYKSHSPSMDILVSSNLERLLYHVSGGDSTLIATLMEDLKTTRKFQVPESLLNALQDEFVVGFAGDLECSFGIRDFYRNSGYVLDPHTAVGNVVLDDYLRATEDCTPSLLTATASPFKFTRTVYQALFDQSPDVDDFQLIRQLSNDASLPMPHRFDGIADWPVLHEDVRGIGELDGYVRSAVGGA